MFYYPGVCVCRGGGGVLIGINHMPGCVCWKVRDMGIAFRPQMKEMNERMSFKMGVNFAVSFHMVKIWGKSGQD